MSAIGDWFKRIGHLLATGAADVDHNTLQTIDVWDQIQADTLNLANTLKDLKKFEFDPKWKTRVINAPRAIEAVQDTFDIITHGIRDKYFELYQSVLTLVAALEGTVHHLPPNPEGSSLMTKIVDEVGALNVAWHAFGTAYHKATDFVQMIDDVKQKVESLDDFFLPQGTPKTLGDFRYRKRGG